MTPDLEYEILDKIAVSADGIGSGSLLLHLQDLELGTSQATVGRVLRLLDHRGLTARVSNKGRVLTPAGRHHLKDLHHKERLRSWADAALRETKPTTQAEILLVLEALCCVESRLAALAAEHATPQQLDRMRKALSEQRCRLRSASRGKVQGLEFHELVARAADNRYLKSACEMIWSWNKTVHDLWTEADLIIGRSSYPDHVRVLAAIENRDPGAAHLAMEAHFAVFIRGLKGRFRESLSRTVRARQPRAARRAAVRSRTVSGRPASR
ncbi:MAG: FCD domain-containing protein [Acidobacteriota bacterium]